MKDEVKDSLDTITGDGRLTIIGNFRGPADTSRELQTTGAVTLDASNPIAIVGSDW